MSERTTLTENIVRYGSAALICFSIAVLLYVVVVTLRMSPLTVNRLASLGVAWWLVGCGLLPLTGYWAWRRAQFDRAD
jgi:hypothetical protein